MLLLVVDEGGNSDFVFCGITRGVIVVVVVVFVFLMIYRWTRVVMMAL